MLPLLVRDPTEVPEANGVFVSVVRIRYSSNVPPLLIVAVRLAVAPGVIVAFTAVPVTVILLSAPRKGGV